MVTRNRDDERHRLKVIRDHDLRTPQRVTLEIDGDEAAAIIEALKRVRKLRDRLRRGR